MSGTRECAIHFVPIESVVPSVFGTSSMDRPCMYAAYHAQLKLAGDISGLPMSSVKKLRCFPTSITGGLILVFFFNIALSLDAVRRLPKEYLHIGPEVGTGGPSLFVRTTTLVLTGESWWGKAGRWRAGQSRSIRYPSSPRPAKQTQNYVKRMWSMPMMMTWNGSQILKDQHCREKARRRGWSQGQFWASTLNQA